MKKLWILAVTLLSYLSVGFGYYLQPDESEFINELRQRYQDKRHQPVFRSREGSEHGLGNSYDLRGDYPVNNHGGVYIPQHPFRFGVPESAVADPEVDEVIGGEVEKENIANVMRENENAAPPNELFTVTTRAQANKAVNSNSLPSDMKITHKDPLNSYSDTYFIALVAGCSGAAVFGVIGAGFCFYKFQKNAKAAAEAEYPAYGVTGPNKEHVSPTGGGDRKLAQSAQMYHYQHQKQQMIAMEKTNGERQVSTSDLDSEEENEEGDYTVYECPGLAPTGEMEVKNPLFQDEPTPASPAAPLPSKPSGGGGGDK